MSTIRTKPTAVPRAYVPTTALAKSVEFKSATMLVSLQDGRVIGVPLAWFPCLEAATPAQRKLYEIGGGGVSLYWPLIDEEISIAGLLAGADWQAA